MQITLTDKVTSKDQDELRLGLNAHNSKFFDVDLIKPLGLFICDSQGKKLAGLTGTTTGNWLRIDLLWVSDRLGGRAREVSWCWRQKKRRASEDAVLPRSIRPAFRLGPSTKSWAITSG